MKNDKIHFLPYVGCDYISGGIFGKRIMVMGESHYWNDREEGEVEDYNRPSDFTTEIVNEYIDYREGKIPFQRWMPTFAKFENALAGHETDGRESRRIWQSLLFYNYIQEFLYASNERPTAEQYRAAAAPFFEVLNQYEPDYLIAWGKSNLFYGTPSDRWIPGEDLTAGEEIGHSGRYELNNGKVVKALFIKHPVARFSTFAWDKWHEIIEQLIGGQ